MGTQALLNNFKFNIAFQNKIANSLFFTVIILVILHLTGMLAHFCCGISMKNLFIKITNLDREYNLPAFYQFFALLFSSALLGAIAYVKKKKQDKYFINWLAMSIIFVYLASDEIGKIHERFSMPINKILNLSDYFYYAWVVAAVPLVLLFLFFNLKLLLSLKPVIRFQLLAAGMIFVSGAIGFELLESHLVYIDEEKSPLFFTLVTFEEFFEMFGIVMFIDVLIDYFKNEIIQQNLTEYRNIFQKFANIIISADKGIPLAAKEIN